jgi:hypothetical protein
MLILDLVYYGLIVLLIFRFIMIYYTIKGYFKYKKIYKNKEHYNYLCEGRKKIMQSTIYFTLNYLLIFGVVCYFKFIHIYG